MKQLDEVIDLLAQDAGSLTDALLKTKIVLSKVGEPQLSEWVNHELNGYPVGSQLPPYRKLHGALRGNLSNMRFRHIDHPLPTMHLPKEQVEKMLGADMNGGIATLEELAKGKAIQSQVPIELNGLLGKPLGGGFNIERAWVEISVPEVKQILVEVRSRLLDFLLDLQREIGATSDVDAKTAVAGLDVPGMFANAVFGDNVSIQVGSHQKQVVLNNSSRNFAQLAHELVSKGVSEADVSELERAIKVDGGSPPSTGTFGPSVSGWLKSMLGKAVDASWGVEVGIAANFLTQALQNYYS